MDRYTGRKARYNTRMVDNVRALMRQEESAGARPFYVLTTVILLAVSAFTLFRPPGAMPLARLPLFLSLLAAHLALHWLSGGLVRRQGARYLAVQAALATALALVSGRPELTLALFAALIAETLGLFGLTWQAGAAVVGYALLAGLSFTIIGGAALLGSWLAPSTSTIALLVAFMALYRRQEEARQRSETLLAELEQAHRQLADYAAQVESLTLANERQRMARELHDTLAQGVAGTVLQLEAANAHLESGRFERAADIIGACLRRARDTLAESRAAIDDLRLQHDTLPEHAQRHADRFRRATGIDCHLSLVLAPDLQASPAVVEHAGRIIGEALANVARHAQAQNVWLALSDAEGALHISVRDDGVGFDTALLDAAGHYGLLGIRERARLVGGDFAVKSSAGAGCRLTVTLPLEAR